jgi:hypothetical protein
MQMSKVPIIYGYADVFTLIVERGKKWKRNTDLISVVFDENGSKLIYILNCIFVEKASSAFISLGVFQQQTLISNFSA